jgi:hypothetical protein
VISATRQVKRLGGQDGRFTFIDGAQIIDVTFNQQQYVIIERLKAEGQFGRTDEEIVRNIFLEFLDRRVSRDVAIWTIEGRCLCNPFLEKLSGFAR